MFSFKRLLSLLLSLVMSLSGFQWWTVSPGTAPQPGPSPTPAPTPAPVRPERPDVKRADLDYGDMEYVHYDPAEFNAEVEKLRAAMANGEDFSVIRECYQLIYDELLEAYTLDTIISIQFDLDVNDDYSSEESLYIDSLCTDMMDSACTVLSELARDERYTDEFGKLVGEDGVTAFAEYKPMTDRDKELSDLESALEQEYDKKAADDGYSVEYGGRTYTTENILDGYYSGYLSYSDYYNVYDMLGRKKADVLGDIFLRLVEVRKEQAALAGYDNYVDYRYSEVYGRDFTKEDAAVFESSVKKNMNNMIWGELADMNAFYGDVDYLSVDKQLELLGQYAAKISPELTESYDYMTEHGLCIVGNEPCMYDGSYTTEFYAYREPVIFSHASGDSYDLSTLVHEFGHYNDAFQNPWDNFILDGGVLDLFEIHSTGLECLFIPFYDEIFSANDAKAVQVTGLGSLLYCIVSGCMEDEFQQYIYTTSDTLTVDLLSRKYCEIGSKYGVPSHSGYDYSWVEIPHTFHSPLYYLSYAVSAIVSLDIYTRSLKDRDGAVSKYLELVHMGAYDYSYFEVLEACGLDDFRDDGYVSRISNEVMAQLRVMNRAYRG